ncbi:unnamed protein product [Camellia sinensis]
MLGLQELREDDLRGMLRECDFDGDGALNQMEFCVLMFKLSPELMEHSVFVTGSPSTGTDGLCVLAQTLGVNVSFGDVEITCVFKSVLYSLLASLLPNQNGRDKDGKFSVCD